MKSDKREMEERVREVSSLLGRKSDPEICQIMSKKWDVSERQIRRYIASAEKEWQKYSARRKKDGMGYTLGQLRKLRDQASSRNVVVGRGEQKQVIEVPDLSLVLDITKEEAKLLGLYPAEKKHIDLVGDVNITFKEIIYEEEKPDDGS